MEKKNLSAILDIAIQREEEAYTFYNGLLDKVKDKGVKDSLKFLANEEKKHKEFLVDYKKGKYSQASLAMEKPIDYKIANYLEAPKEDKIDESNIYLLAAHKELQSYNFYQSLAQEHPPGTVRDMLLKIANEEMKHKEKVEYLYSNAAFPQTEGG